MIYAAQNKVYFSNLNLIFTSFFSPYLFKPLKINQINLLWLTWIKRKAVTSILSDVPSLRDYSVTKAAA